jgi:peroxiredoxin
MDTLADDPNTPEPSGRRLGILLALFLAASAGLQYYAHRLQDSLNGEEPRQSSLHNQAAPEFSLEVLEAAPAHPAQPSPRQISLAEHRGKVVLLSFWASWCRPCDYELPVLNQFYLANREHGVAVLAISTDADRQAALRYAEERRLELPMLWDEEGRVADRYQVRSLPTLVIIDPEGRIRQVESGLRYDMESWLRRQVRQLQQNTAAPSAGTS